MVPLWHVDVVRSEPEFGGREAVPSLFCCALITLPSGDPPTVNVNCTWIPSLGVPLMTATKKVIPIKQANWVSCCTDQRISQSKQNSFCLNYKVIQTRLEGGIEDKSVWWQSTTQPINQQSIQCMTVLPVTSVATFHPAILLCVKRLCALGFVF